MARLTERDKNGSARIIGVDSEGWELILKYDEYHRIMAVVSEAAMFEEAQEAGKLFFLEHIPGDIVYVAIGDEVMEIQIFNVCISDKCEVIYIARVPGDEDKQFILSAEHIYSSEDEAEGHLGEYTYES